MTLDPNYWYWKGLLGPIGKHCRPTGYYFRVKIERHIGYIDVLKKDDQGQWIKIGERKTSNGALKLLEAEVERMEMTERGLN